MKAKTPAKSEEKSDEEADEAAAKLETPVAKKGNKNLNKAKLSLTDLQYERSLGSARKAAQALDESREGTNMSGMTTEIWSAIKEPEKAAMLSREFLA